jgi:hypothetical protein
MGSNVSSYANGDQNQRDWKSKMTDKISTYANIASENIRAVRHNVTETIKHPIKTTRNTVVKTIEYCRGGNFDLDRPTYELVRTCMDIDSKEFEGISLIFQWVVQAANLSFRYSFGISERSYNNRFVSINYTSDSIIDFSNNNIMIEDSLFDKILFFLFNHMNIIQDYKIYHSENFILSNGTEVIIPVHYWYNIDISSLIEPDSYQSELYEEEQYRQKQIISFFVHKSNKSSYKAVMLASLVEYDSLLSKFQNIVVKYYREHGINTVEAINLSANVETDVAQSAFFSE